MSSCVSTHKLKITTLGTQVTREWINLTTGLVETDAAVIAQLEASLVPGIEGCEDKQVECVESQEWTYGLDNTGTRFNEDNTIQVTLSDGSTFTFNQPPQTGWTNQLINWAAEIQAAADAKGLAWFVEPRCILAGNSVTGCGGLPGPPSLPIAQELFTGGMRYRYANIQICPAQPVPVKMEIIASSNPIRVGRTLLTAGAVKGPYSKFFVCRGCGDEPIWYQEDGITPLAAGEIPDCYEPCGTLAQVPPPPDSLCTHVVDEGCDDLNDPDPLNWVSTITRRASICEDGVIQYSYLEPDPLDPTALIDYTMVGSFVDCTSGEVPPDPELPCEVDCVDCVSEDNVEVGSTLAITGVTPFATALPIMQTELGVGANGQDANLGQTIPVTYVSASNNNDGEIHGWRVDVPECLTDADVRVSITYTPLIDQDPGDDFDIGFVTANDAGTGITPTAIAGGTATGNGIIEGFQPLNVAHTFSMDVNVTATAYIDVIMGLQSGAPNSDSVSIDAVTVEILNVNASDCDGTPRKAMLTTLCEKDELINAINDSGEVDEVFAPIQLPDVCINVDDVPQYATPLVWGNTTTKALDTPLYLDREGNLITGVVTTADPCDCDCLECGCALENCAQTASCVVYKDFKAEYFRPDPNPSVGVSQTTIDGVEITLTSGCDLDGTTIGIDNGNGPEDSIDDVNTNLETWINTNLGSLGFAAVPNPVLWDAAQGTSPQEAYMELTYPTCGDWTFDVQNVPSSFAGLGFNGIRYSYIGGVFDVQLIDAAGVVVTPPVTGTSSNFTNAIDLKFC